MNPVEQMRELVMAVLENRLEPRHIELANQMRDANWLAALAGGNPEMIRELNEEVTLMLLSQLQE
jgi:hypothetical protein